MKVDQKMNSGTYNVSRPIKTEIPLKCIMEEDTIISKSVKNPSIY